MPLDPFQIDSVRKALRDRGLWLNKSRGQNYLVNRSIAERIVESVPEGQTVFEVGSGLGSLTGLLSNKFKTYSIEIDSGIYALLSEDPPSTSANLTLIHGDFLEYDPDTLPEPSLYLVSNLPYSISGEAVRKFIACGKMTEGVVMLQEDFVRRMMSGPGEPDYSVLSILSHFFLETERLFDVPRNYFFPVPTVDSVVVRLKKTGCPLDQDAFNAFLRRSFLSRRKTLGNNLKGAGFTSVKFEELGIDPGVRPENLPIEKWPELFQSLPK